MRNWPIQAAILFVLMTTLSCTRGVEKKLSMALTFNSSSGNSSLALTGKLNFAVINIQLPTGPVVREFEFDDNPIPAGQGFSLEVPNVPKGSFLVQFLGIYEEDGVASKFAYGDAIAVVEAANSEVNIVTSEIGAFSKEGRVSGRYINQLSAPYGPTGELVMRFQPPDLTKPKMNLHPFPIVQGWFSVMALDGAKMDYVLLPGNEVIFKDIRINGSNLEIDGVTVATGNHLAKFSAPAHYVAESGSGKIRSIAPTDLWVGFFKSAALSSSVLTGKQACYANNVHEMLPAAYRTRTVDVLTDPLEVKTVSGTATEVRPIAGGVADTQDAIYLESGSNCIASGENKIIINHTTLDEDGDRVGGMSPPFRALRPFARWDKYIAASYAAPASIPTLKLQWDYIPGLDSSAFTGVAILAKPSSNSGGGDKQCLDLITQGYVEVGATNSLSTKEFQFSGPVTAANRYSWSFALCGFHLVDGVRRYIGRPITGGQLGDGNVTHVGWAPSTKNYSGASTDYMIQGGETYKVTAVSATALNYTAVTVSSAPSAVAGDELMFAIVGSSGSCGTHNGDTNSIGKYGFARVMGISGSIIKIAKGSFMDELDGSATVAESNYGNPFCHVQAFKVLQYRTLSLTGNFTFDSGNFPFNYAGGTTGGHIPIRVNGLLSLSSASLNTDGVGFVGGMSVYPTGAGTEGPSTVSGANGTGGQGAMPSGAGGAGYGSGGTGNAIATPGYLSSSNGVGRMVLGGGGGHGNTSDGGNGGGSIFIAARETYIGGPSIISSNGSQGTSTDGGGGGGGSVIFLTGKITGTGPVSLQANGGAGGSNATAGVGGGGTVDALACAGTTTFTAAATKGSIGDTTGALDGYANIISASSWPNLCQLLK